MRFLSWVIDLYIATKQIILHIFKALSDLVVRALYGHRKGVHSKKRTTCSGLMKTALNNVVLPTLFNVVNNIVEPELARNQV